MEDDLKINKVEYLSNYLLDNNQILILSLHEQTVFYKSLNWRQTSNGRQTQNIKSGKSQQPLGS
jgi:hypothetical protein